jgi:Ni,Fe-hydrogenase III component G
MQPTTQPILASLQRAEDSTQSIWIDRDIAKSTAIVDEKLVDDRRLVRPLDLLFLLLFSVLS